MKLVLIGRGIVRIDYDLCLVRVDFVRRLIVCNSGLWRRGVSSRTVRDSSRAGVRRAMADMRKRLRPGFESICGIGISWLRLRSASGFRPARSLFLDRFPLSLSCRLLLFRYAVGPTLRCPYPEADRGFPGEVSEKRVRVASPDCRRGSGNGRPCGCRVDS